MLKKTKANYRNCKAKAGSKKLYIHLGNLLPKNLYGCFE